MRGQSSESLEVLAQSEPPEPALSLAGSFLGAREGPRAGLRGRASPGGPRAGLGGGLAPSPGGTEQAGSPPAPPAA